MDLEFDFTVVRGLEALHKELGSMKVPLILLGTQDAVKNILIGATNVSIPDVSNEHELDELLQGLVIVLHKDRIFFLRKEFCCRNYIRK